MKKDSSIVLGQWESVRRAYKEAEDAMSSSSDARVATASAVLAAVADLFSESCQPRRNKPRTPRAP